MHAGPERPTTGSALVRLSRTSQNACWYTAQALGPLYTPLFDNSLLPCAVKVLMKQRLWRMMPGDWVKEVFNALQRMMSGSVVILWPPIVS